MERSVHTHDKIRNATGMPVHPSYVDHTEHVTSGEVPVSEYERKLREYHNRM